MNRWAVVLCLLPSVSFFAMFADDSIDYLHDLDTHETNDCNIFLFRSEKRRNTGRAGYNASFRQSNYYL